MGAAVIARRAAFRWGHLRRERGRAATERRALPRFPGRVQAMPRAKGAVALGNGGEQTPSWDEDERAGVLRVDETRRFELHVPPRPALVGAGADDHVLARRELENMHPEALARVDRMIGVGCQARISIERRRSPRNRPTTTKGARARIVDLQRSRLRQNE